MMKKHTTLIIILISSLTIAFSVPVMADTEEFISSALNSYGTERNNETLDSSVEYSKIDDSAAEKQSTSSGSSNVSNKQSSSTGGSSTSLSKEDQKKENAKSAKNGVTNTLAGYLNRAEQNMSNGDNLSMLYSSGKPTSISNIGYYDVPTTDFINNVVQPALNLRNTYSDLISPLGLSSGTYGSPHDMSEIDYEYAAPQYIYVEDSNGNLVQKDAVSAGGGSGSGSASDGERSFDYSVYEDVLNSIEKTQIANRSSSGGSGGSTTKNIKDYATGNDFQLINFNDNVGMYDINHTNDSYDNGSSFGNKHLPVSGIRSDLVTGGLYDATDWFNRFTPYTSLYSITKDENGNDVVTSNAMSDDITVALIDEYAIESLTEDEIKATHYYENTRRWEIINAETGELYGSPITQNPEITLKNEKGTWVVTPFQKADYTIGTYGSWVKRQYLFDACTMNLLYFNENATSGTVCVNETTATGWIPTGTSFVLYCDGYGNVTSDEDDYYSGIERVK